MKLEENYIKESEKGKKTDKQTIVSDDIYLLGEAICDLTKEIERLRHG